MVGDLCWYVLVADVVDGMVSGYAAGRKARGDELVTTKRTRCSFISRA
jgi:hypothetical protein